MNAREHLDQILKNHRTYFTLGLGTGCWGLVNSNFRDQVVLLERPKEMGTQSKVNVNPLAGSTAKMHSRAARFAQTYDRYLLEGLIRADGGHYQHCELLSVLSPKDLDEPKLFHLGGGALFPVHSVRVVRRIQGTPLDYRIFSQKNSPFSNKNRMDSLAKDIAHWLYNVHHEISPKAMAGNKIYKQFSDTGVEITRSFQQSEKYKLLVTRNTKELETIQRNMQEKNMAPEIRERMLRNLEATGITMPQLVEIAQTLSARLKKIMPLDRYGLSHTDIHPGNIIVDSTMTNVNGICDWANGTIGPQSMDFAGIGIAKGLLPKVVEHYTKKEQASHAQQRTNKEAIFCLAAMRQLFLSFKTIKYGDTNPQTHLLLGQVQECISELHRLDRKAYHNLHIMLKGLRKNKKSAKFSIAQDNVASNPTPVHNTQGHSESRPKRGHQRKNKHHTP